MCVCNTREKTYSKSIFVHGTHRLEVEAGVRCEVAHSSPAAAAPDVCLLLLRLPLRQQRNAA